MTPSSTVNTEKNRSSRSWYDSNADRFEDTQAIEMPFLGLDREAQDRLNHFKLYALDSREHIDLDGKTVLEFGAGHGRLALAYPGMARYVGVDFSANLVEIGNRRIARAGLQDRATLIHGDVLTFDAPPESFDVVCSLGMITYFPDPEPALRHMVRFLKPGGVLFFDFRCNSGVYAVVRRIKWAIKKPTGGSSHMIYPDRVEQILQRLGCSNIKIISREFPVLAGLYARRGWEWPLRLRNWLAGSRTARRFATEAWAVALLLHL